MYQWYHVISHLDLVHVWCFYIRRTQCSHLWGAGLHSHNGLNEVVNLPMAWVGSHCGFQEHPWNMHGTSMDIPCFYRFLVFSHTCPMFHTPNPFNQFCQPSWTQNNIGFRLSQKCRIPNSRKLMNASDHASDLEDHFF